ncbi:hypothetical protein A2Y83_03800 [Candidatus Falkowbacteria bacterium RBG_13_39_14]|uniref:Fructose-bisphosphate aldolase n=1 Tax=Candidatus Falkowbacteria bacterium RBG_13_39_14 TaxID=1797985 RepID=A0A1F5S7T3_9BACT|nr:MAG: hypothetical protein A2Y83_03800 [Candidatus Falkowbacteria bacterium RBG_13_39_14]
MNDKKDILKKITNKSNKIIVVPIDYGVYKGPIIELESLNEVLPKILKGNINGILLHKGLIKDNYQLFKESKIPYFLHISALTGLGNPINKVLAGSVSEAKELGAVGVSMLVYLGNDNEGEMLKMLGKVSREADEQGLLLYVMMYVADYKYNIFKEDTSLNSVKWAARVGYELGADIVEVRHPDQPINFNDIKKICPIPLLIADSAKYSEEEYKNLLNDCKKSNIDGISISKRILDPKNTEKILRDIDKVFG